jgi:HK97 family phage prohead protease
MSTSLRFDDRSPEARTLDVCIAPYRAVVTVNDGEGPYEETFLPGAFRDQVEEAQSSTRPLRIWLTCEHSKGVDNVIGHAVRLRDLPGGLYGSFRVTDGIEGDETLAMVRDGVFSGVSMEALPLRSRTVDGVTQRIRAHLDTVSFGQRPAYRDAKVLGIRKGLWEEQPGPASPAELRSWDLERMERALSALARKCIDESTRSYTRDPHYQELLQHLAAIKKARQPKRQVLRRALSGPITIR